MRMFGFKKTHMSRVKLIAAVSAFLMLTILNTLPAMAVEEVSGDDIYEDPVDAFLADSAFVGNSISVGLTMYNDYKGKEPLGDAIMLTRQSYSFYNDSKGSTNFLPRLNGVPMQAKDAISKCGADNVFICMGTNDLVGSSGAENAYKNYRRYLTEILRENPDITIFIESCTPSRPGSNVINSKVLAFNSYMKEYCDVFPNMYYIDIASPLSDGEGFLQSGYASDGSVHLTNSAYSIWAETVRNFISDYLEMKKETIREQNERERQIAQANYERNMRDMEEKKQEAFEEHMAEVRAEEAAEEERRRYELLNVPNEAELYEKLKNMTLQCDTIYGMID